jgi:hypothetical protein
MSRGKVFNEPAGIDASLPTYTVDLTKALHWYNREKEKKDARAYLRRYASKHLDTSALSVVDAVSDYHIVNSFGWAARVFENGGVLSTKHVDALNTYIKQLTASQVASEPVIAKSNRPSVIDLMEEKVKDYIGELEGFLDEFISSGVEINLYDNLRSNTIPIPYCRYIRSWLEKKITEFSEIAESGDKDVREGYSNIAKRKQTQLGKMLDSWLADLDKYSQFKKANRKVRVKRARPAGVQVAKLKYKKEDEVLGLRSVSPADIVGASQVWIYNCNTKKLAAFRTDSATGIQVKGSSLQNYDPEMCEQKRLRNPSETLATLLTAGKLVLRKLLTNLPNTNIPVSGRISEDCLIVRVLK